MSISAAERELVAMDTQLPGLASLLDIELLNSILAKETSSGITIQARHYVRYKFGTNCLVLYTAVIAGQPLRIYAKAYGSDFDDKLHKIAIRANQDWDAHREGENLWVLPSLRVVIRKFPADGKLRSLKVMHNPQKARRFLARLLGDKPEFRDADFSELAYKPERRFVARVEGKDGKSAVIKFYGRHAFERSRRNLAYLKQVGYRNLPQQMGRSRRRMALAFDWHKGDTLRERAAEGAPLKTEAAELGRQLAKLHRLPPGIEIDNWKPQAEFARLRMLSDSLTKLVPRRRDDVFEIIRRIESAIIAVPIRNTLIHGDFHSRQILLCDSGIRFLDVDELSTGPAVLDTGTFVAHVNRDVLRSFLSRDVADSIIDGFLGGYESAGGCAEHINAYTALSLLRFSHHPFRACEADWDRGIEQIIDLILQVTADLQSQPRIKVGSK